LICESRNECMAPPMNPETNDLYFQCKDILSRDIYLAREFDVEDYDSDTERTSYKKTSEGDNKRFQIEIFGTDSIGRSITLQIENFCPFFYVRIPKVLANKLGAIENFKDWICNGVKLSSHALLKMTLESHKTLFDYNGGEMGVFLKITVPSLFIWRALKDRLLTKSCEPKEYEVVSLFGPAAIPVLQTSVRGDDVAVLSADGTRIALKVYEANIDPVLRFFHIRNISPAGWIRIPAESWEINEKGDAKTTICAKADWMDVAAGEDAGMAPYLVASWDIECTSSHGDFPLAKKTYRKVVRDMYERYIPDTVVELCDMLAAAMNRKKSRISPIYLKHMPTVLGETLRLMLVGKQMESRVQEALHALRLATKTTRETAMTNLDTLLTAGLPQIAGDEIIQIGTVLYKRGVAVSKHIWVLGPAEGDVVEKASIKPPGADVPIEAYAFRDEGLLLRAWFYWIGKIQPDVMIGYNIFGFDSKYVYDRLEETVPKDTVIKALAPLSCLYSRPPRLEEKFLSSSAMGDNTMWFLSSPGRLQIDLLPYVRRNHNLDSYSLDNVSATFMSGSIQGPLVAKADDVWQFKTKSTKGIVVGRYITLMDVENDRVVDRCLVVGIEPKALSVRIEHGTTVLAEHGLAPVRWAQVKDDVSPQDIFRLHRGSARDRAVIAKYCLQDCDLVMELFTKLEVLNNSVAMANVCSVPVSYIFLRGQGIKIESLIFKECRIADQLIEVMYSAPREEATEIKETGSDDEPVEDSYEGAIVLDPHTDIYIDDPVTANDFSSLYPSSIISENISHDTLIWVKDFDNDGTFLCIREGSDRYDNLPDAKYVDIEFDILRPDPTDTRKNPTKIRDGRRIARYIQQPQGTIPRILEMLLANRKKTRKLAEKESDEFRKALLDAQQLAYKLTANSLYGQLGSATFKIRRQVLAASTTGYGRKQLMYAKAVMEAVYSGGKDPRCDLECVYGDTDSIFLRFRPKDPATGTPLTGHAALVAAKDLTVESGKLVSSCLKAPHDFEFDKIFRSFCLLSKKRYVGDMSEDGLEDGDFHRKSMGIVMKRRDNAPIVKYVYGGAIDRILNPTHADKRKGVREAFAFVQSACRDLLAGKFPLTKLTITKSLRAEYADPTRIAHKVLADRIGERDPGNKPSTSDRIPFVYIQVKGEVKLQGDRIETPSYIREHKLTPDYSFYITNQIAKPIAQVFGLALEHIPGIVRSDIENCTKARDPVAAREALAEKLLFGSMLRSASTDPATMTAKGQHSMASFLIKK